MLSNIVQGSDKDVDMTPEEVRTVAYAGRGAGRPPNRASTVMHLKRPFHGSGADTAHTSRA
jgi:hypothetical protein